MKQLGFMEQEINANGIGEIVDFRSAGLLVQTCVLILKSALHFVLLACVFLPVVDCYVFTFTYLPTVHFPL